MCMAQASGKGIKRRQDRLVSSFMNVHSYLNGQGSKYRQRYRQVDPQGVDDGFSGPRNNALVLSDLID